MAKVKFPLKLDISVFYKLTRRLPHKDLNYDDERLLIHFYDTFCNESIMFLGKMVRCRTNYHLLDKIGKEPNADLFQFMKGPSHKQTEEEIKFVFDRLGWDYSLLCGAQPLSGAKPVPLVPAPALASKVSLSPSTHNL